jgi:uncharacterized membrane protein|tara:strand:- start:839 stop:1204 length:366 start_codon:yes stop_codon:yes gene_type:complete
MISFAKFINAVTFVFVIIACVVTAIMVLLTLGSGMAIATIPVVIGSILGLYVVFAIVGLLGGIFEQQQILISALGGNNTFNAKVEPKMSEYEKSINADDDDERQAEIIARAKGETFFSPRH